MGKDTYTFEFLNEIDNAARILYHLRVRDSSLYSSQDSDEASVPEPECKRQKKTSPIEVSPVVAPSNPPSAFFAVNPSSINSLLDLRSKVSAPNYIPARPSDILERLVVPLAPAARVGDTSNWVLENIKARHAYEHARMEAEARAASQTPVEARSLFHKKKAPKRGLNTAVETDTQAATTHQDRNEPAGSGPSC